MNTILMLFTAVIGAALATTGVIAPESLAFLGAFGVVDAIKSSIITNATATPQVINSARIDGAKIRHKRAVGTLVTAAAEAASTIRFFRVKSNDIVHKLWLDATSFGTGCTAHVGLYRTNDDGGAVADADLFASAVDMAAAQRATDVTRESGVITVANMEKRIWELLGLTQDPQIEYDVVLTLAVAATVAGTACLQAEVVGGD